MQVHSKKEVILIAYKLGGAFAEKVIITNG